MTRKHALTIIRRPTADGSVVAHRDTGECYLVNEYGCSCLDFAYRGHLYRCKHCTMVSIRKGRR